MIVNLTELVNIVSSEEKSEQFSRAKGILKISLSCLSVAVI